MKHTIVYIVFFIILIQIPTISFAKGAKIDQSNYLNSELFSGLTFRNIGPALTSGRISDIAIHPCNSSTWYVVVGSGGVWKTVNSGTTWKPVFNRESSYSIGCVAIDPNQPDIIWVGTGENVSGRHVGFGDGIYRSKNGGKTWENMGLKKSEHISKILIDPRHSDVIYVAAEGPLWSSGGERGLYKSTNCGQSWTLSLNVSNDTGVTDIAFEPGNPDILYAAAYQRRRSVAAFIGGGPESAIYKSIDAGKHWEKLTVGLPKDHVGRIGLAVSPIKPNVVYATIEAGNKEKGFYCSVDRGESWEKRNSYISGGTGPHYYQEIYASPHRFDCVYQMDVWLHVTEDGGKTFHKVGEKHKHSDNHALAFIPQNPDYLLAGCDGGIYESWDRGKTWKFAANLPVPQFYKMALDNDLPFYNINGGTQDNGTLMGPSRTLNINGIMNSDWFFTGGADGYACDIDPQEPNIVYVEWQGGKLQRYDKKSGQIISIQPQPEPGDDPPRWNWDSPLLISPHSHTRLYFGSQRLYRSDDRGDSWTPISPDLSRNIFRLEEKIMGKKWSSDALWDHEAMSFFGNLTAISESPLKEGLLYVGTDDGLIHVSENNGKSWRKIDKIPGVPPFFFANDIKASLHDIDTVYIALDNHKTGDLKPYLMKSIDRGHTWTSIATDLPHPLIVWAIAQDHVNPDLLFIGTESGLYFTLDGGNHWTKFTGGLPTISFRDIEIQRRENDLVGASFGRGFFILDDYSPLRHIDRTTFESDAVLFPVKKALIYIPRKPLELEGKAFMGDAFYTAPNPPYGAVFTYFLNKPLITHQEKRRMIEKQREKQNQPINFPGWKLLRAENREEPPAIILTVKDKDGNIVRRITGPVKKGINRVTWDLRYPSPAPTKLEQPKDVEPWNRPARGPLVIPGTFTVQMAKRTNGLITPMGNPQTFTVESLELATLSAKNKKELLTFQAKASDLQRAMKGAEALIKETLNHLAFMKKALMDTPAAPILLKDKINTIENQLKDIQIQISGDRLLKKRGEPRTPSLLERVSKDAIQLSATTGITQTHKRNYEIAASTFESLLKKLRQLIDRDLETLKGKLDEAGAPWTPGRGVPNWKKNNE